MLNNMDPLLTQLIDDLDHFDQLTADERREASRRGVQVSRIGRAEVDQLLDQLLQPQRLDRLAGGAADPLLQEIFFRLLRRMHKAAPAERLDQQPATRQRVVELYRRLGPRVACRHLLLALLLVAGSRAEADAVAQLLVEDPPQEQLAVMQAFAPLFQDYRHLGPMLFPQLLDAVRHRQIAAPVLDLANFLVRQQLVDRHPAAERVDQLASLLGEVAQRLACLEEQPPDSGGGAAELSKTVAEAVNLVVALCDALALIGDARIAGKLRQAMQLGHRRLRIEAAAALARLGDEEGKEIVVQMAAEPIVRLRAIAYAEELGCLDRIDQQYRTPVARAEAELALHLAQPTQMGMPPTRCELVDQRTQYWPGYDQPVECFLFRYTYVLGQRQYSNIGIVGPMTGAFTADLADLPPDDIYAIYAGWQAEHDEMYEVEMADCSDRQRQQAEQLQRRLAREGYGHIEPLALASFFSDPVLIARASRGPTPGVAAVSDTDLLWLRSTGGPRSFTASQVYSIFKGRRLLRAFNPRSS